MMFAFNYMRQLGLTLIELMVTLIIVSIIAALSTANLTRSLVSTSADKDARELADILRFARTEAIRTDQNACVSILPKLGPTPKESSTAIRYAPITDTTCNATIGIANKELSISSVSNMTVGLVFERRSGTLIDGIPAGNKITLSLKVNDKTKYIDLTMTPLGNIEISDAY